jgi:peptidoglycan hydrolase-like protein with peptidoglycan-binding domain
LAHTSSKSSSSSSVKKATDALKRSVDALKKAIDGLKDELDALKDRSNELERAQKGVLKVLDKEIERLKEQRDLVEETYDLKIKAIDDEIDRLRKKKEEEDLALKLQKAKDALENARINKTRRVYYADQGWVWEVDQDKINDLQEEIADIELDNSNAPTKGMNDDSVAIVALGNYEATQMPTEQKEALKRVVRDVVQHYAITDIRGHYEVAGRGYTDCPGQYFPLEEVRAYALSGNEVIEVQPDPAPVPSPATSFVLNRILKFTGDLSVQHDLIPVQRNLIALGFSCGRQGADGKFGDDTRKTVVAFQKSRDLSDDGIVGQYTCEALGGSWQPKTANPNYRFTLTKILKVTSPLIRNSDEVRAVQRTLIEFGFGVGSNGVDGIYGNDTKNAVAKFQKARGLTEDGVVGENTCKAFGGRWDGN